MDTRFDIIVHGHIPPGWSVLFDGMELTCRPDGNTLIAGHLPDQSALFGLLLRLRDLGLALVSVNPAALEGAENHETNL
jgi:hypothetical protein